MLGPQVLMKPYFSQEEMEGWNVEVETEVSGSQRHTALKAFVKSLQVIFKSGLLYTFLYYWNF